MDTNVRGLDVVSSCRSHYVAELLYCVLIAAVCCMLAASGSCIING